MVTKTKKVWLPKCTLSATKWRSNQFLLLSPVTQLDFRRRSGRSDHSGGRSLLFHLVRKGMCLCDFFCNSAVILKHFDHVRKFVFIILHIAVSKRGKLTELTEYSALLRTAAVKVFLLTEIVLGSEFDLEKVLERVGNC